MLSHNFISLQDFRPTTLDQIRQPPDGMEVWVVSSICRHRDSEPDQKSNFEVAISELVKVQEEGNNWAILRYGHWGTGWFEIIVFDPNDQPLLEQVEKMQASIKDYPIMDEDHYSDLCFSMRWGPYVDWNEETEDEDV